MQTRQETHTAKQKRRRILGPCASIFVSMKTGTWRLERPEVDFKTCSKCGTCATYCPVDAVTIDKESEECVKIMWDYCKGCGICANECPKKCIKMVDERGGEHGAL